jgi:hypothetical protein
VRVPLPGGARGGLFEGTESRVKRATVRSCDGATGRIGVNRSVKILTHIYHIE